ncbi:MAG: hypothetical protein ACI9G1_004246 [Pirellulaceae bacterium]|jgi:hypothetical protein
MTSRNWTKWTLLVGANVLAWCMLSLYGPIGAAPKGGVQPFANSVDQRNEMIRELKEINTLLSEQNQLLKKLNLSDAKPAQKTSGR